MLSARARWLLALTLSTGATAALAYPARAYDLVRFDCAQRTVADAQTLAAIIAVSIAALAIAWMIALHSVSLAESRVTFRDAILGVVPAHLVALMSSPFLSKDVLYYTAIGRVISRYHDSPYRRLALTMNHDDAFWIALPAPWRNGTSAYFPGFHAICAGVAAIAGDNLTLAIRLHQVLGCACMIGAAMLAAIAARTSGALADRGGDVALRAAPIVATLVGLCPLAIVDATGSAHNDAWLALGLAAATFFFVQGRLYLVVLSLAFVALIKPTGALLAIVALVAIACDHRRKQRQFSARTIRSIVALGAIVSVLAFAIALPWIRKFTESFDLNHPPMTTEAALETIPRILLFANGDRGASIAIGIAMRCLGLVWMAVLVMTTLADGRALARIATALFGFYVFFSGWNHTWYVLPVLTLVPFADPKWQRAMLAGMATAPIGYATMSYFMCGYPHGWTVWAVAATSQAAIANGIPIALRVIDRKR